MQSLAITKCFTHRLRSYRQYEAVVTVVTCVTHRTRSRHRQVPVKYAIVSFLAVTAASFVTVFVHVTSGTASIKVMR